MNQAGETRPGRLLSIGEVTSLTGVGRSTIRHWEREFQDFLKSVRTEGNQRRFNPDAIDKIEKIKSLVEEQGLTLKGARLRLEKRAAQPEADNAGGPERSRDPSVEKLADLMTDHIIRRLFYDR